MDPECRLLIVDDDLSFRRLVEKEFKALDYTVKCVSDAEKALEVLDVFRPHIIILDLLLPKMDGFELAKRIKQKPGFQSIHILMVTAVYLDEEDIKRAIKGGANGYFFKPDLILTKPVHIKELRDAVESMRKESFDYTPEQKKARDRILIIDDDEKNRKLLKMRLLSENFDVVEAEDGTKGLELAESENVDLILLDIKMPGMSGLDVLTEFEKKEVEVPVVMMTAYGSESIAVEAFKKGATDYLIKPFDTQMAAKRVADIIEKNSLRKSNEKLVERLKSISIDLISRLNVMEVQNSRLEEAYLRHKELSDFNQEFVRAEASRIENSLSTILNLLQSSDVGKVSSIVVKEVFFNIISLMNLARLTTIQARLCHPNLKKVDISKELQQLISSISNPTFSDEIKITFLNKLDESIETTLDTLFLKEIIFNILSNCIVRLEKEGEIIVSVRKRSLDGKGIIVDFFDAGRKLEEKEFSKLDLDTLGAKSYKTTGEAMKISLCSYLCEILGWNLGIPNGAQDNPKITLEIPVS